MKLSRLAGAVATGGTKRKAGWTARNAVVLGVLMSLIVLAFAGATAAAASIAPGAAAAQQRQQDLQADRAAVAAAVPGGTLNPLSIPKYVTPLVIPPAMPESSLNTYNIAVKQFDQYILPQAWSAANGIAQTKVWSYGLVEDLPGTLNYPAFTIEASVNQPTDVKWVNGLVDGFGNYLPHLVPVDQTLHWANPNKSGIGGVVGTGTTDSKGVDPNPYTGPVPIITHVHGAHVGPESDGYPEAWYLPAANNIPPGYATRGSHWGQVAGAPDEPGAAYFSYPNDQPAATLWYHDHALGMTRNNVMAGPAGFYLLRGGTNDTPAGVLPGPAPARGDAAGTKYYEIPIAIQDRSFNVNGSIFFPDNRAFFEGLNLPPTPFYLDIPFIPDLANGGLPSDVSPIWNPEFLGNTMVVNGKTWPYLNVEARRYRFRLLNGCNARTLQLQMSNPAVPTAVPTIWQIGGDQGFLPAPLLLPQLLMMPAERNDVIVDFTGLEGRTIILENVGPDVPFSGANAPTDLADPGTTGQVMQFRVGPVDPANPDTSTNPSTIVSLPAAGLPGPATNTRHLSLNEEESATVTVTVDGAGNLVYDPASIVPFGPTAAKLGTFDPGTGLPTVLNWMDPITEKPTVGTTEMWEIKNFTVDAHPIHLHQVAFEVVERQIVDATSPHWTGPTSAGVIVPRETWEAGYKDTVIAYPGEITRVKALFDIVGLYVWHCHIIDHEDNEMMRAYLVLADATALDHFSFATIGSPQTAGAAFTATITAQDASGNTVAYNGTATLTDSTGTITPTTATFVNGVATPSVTITQAQTGVTITATDGATTGTSNSFTVGNPTITVTNPAGPVSWATGSSQPVGWSLNTEVSTGRFAMWLISSTGNYVTGAYVPVQAGLLYAPTLSLTGVAPDAGYMLRVSYQAVVGGPWVATGYSAPTIEVTGGAFPTITVTDPPGAVSWATGSSQPVGWSLSTEVSTGRFAMWLISSTGNYVTGAYVPVQAGLLYAPTLSLAGVAPDAGYMLRVSYQDVVGGPWVATGYSAPTIEVTAGAFPTITVTDPPGAISWASGSSQPVGWSLNTEVSTGRFAMWLISSTGSYVTGAYVPVQAGLLYAPTLSLAGVAPALGYKLRVSYQDVVGGPWVASGYSAPTIEVTP